VQFNDPDFAAFQWLGARGFNTGYLANPEEALTRKDAAARLQRVLHTIGKGWKMPENLDGSLFTETDLRMWLKDAGYVQADAHSENRTATVTVRNMAVVLFQNLIR
jgi:hypothetical protein